MKRFFKIVLKTFLFLILGYIVYVIILDRIYEYEEYYRITDVNVTFLNPVGEENGCVILDKITTIDSTKTTIVGLKYKVETFSEQIHLFHNILGPYIPDGGFGHTDKVTEFELQLNSNKGERIMLENKFNSAEVYKYFQIKGVETIDMHSTHRGCYMANTYESLDEFIDIYNNDVDYNVSDFNVYHFFILDHEKLENTPLTVDTVKVHLKKVRNELPPKEYRFQLLGDIYL